MRQVPRCNIIDGVGGESSKQGKERNFDKPQFREKKRGECAGWPESSVKSSRCSEIGKNLQADPTTKRRLKGEAFTGNGNTFIGYFWGEENPQTSISWLGGEGPSKGGVVRINHCDKYYWVKGAD